MSIHWHVDRVCPIGPWQKWRISKILMRAHSKYFYTCYRYAYQHVTIYRVSPSANRKEKQDGIVDIVAGVLLTIFFFSEWSNPRPKVPSVIWRKAVMNCPRSIMWVSSKCNLALLNSSRLQPCQSHPPERMCQVSVSAPPKCNKQQVISLASVMES